MAEEEVSTSPAPSSSEEPSAPPAPEADDGPIEPSDEFAVEPESPDDVVFRLLNVDSVLYDLTDGSPNVHLLEAEQPYRYLVVPLALPDAVAVQYALSDIEGRRPSSHELFTTILGRLHGEVIAARIVRYESGVFYAELDLMTPGGREVIDARTSDAIALALRQKVPAPILCAESVFQSFYS